jgi:hypothetical protein
MLAQQSIDTHDMPPEAAAAFAYYCADGYRSLRKVALHLNIPVGTVLSWSSRYAWSARLRNEELEIDSGSFAASVSALSLLRLSAVQVIAAVMTDVEQPGKVRLDAATRIMDRTGLTPMRVTRSLEAPEPESDVSDAAIADAVTAASAGDPAALAELIARARKSLA